MKPKKIKVPVLSQTIKKYVPELGTPIWSNLIDIPTFNNDAIYRLYDLTVKFNDYKRGNLVAEHFTVANTNIFNIDVNIKNADNLNDLEVIQLFILHEVNRRGFETIIDFGQKTAGIFFGKYPTFEELNLKRKIEDWYYIDNSSYS
jgi:hypothetical protein